MRFSVPTAQEIESAYYAGMIQTAQSGVPARGHSPFQQINRALHRIPVVCKKKFGDARPLVARTMAAASIYHFIYHSIDHVRANIDQLVRACTDVPTGLTRLLLGLPLSNQAVASLADET